jgi:hypothetical protein
MYPRIRKSLENRRSLSNKDTHQTGVYRFLRCPPMSCYRSISSHRSSPRMLVCEPPALGPYEILRLSARPARALYVAKRNNGHKKLLVLRDGGAVRIPDM